MNCSLHPSSGGGTVYGQKAGQLGRIFLFLFCFCIAVISRQIQSAVQAVYTRSTHAQTNTHRHTLFHKSHSPNEFSFRFYYFPKQTANLHLKHNFLTVSLYTSIFICITKCDPIDFCSPQVNYHLSILLFKHLIFQVITT